MAKDKDDASTDIVETVKAFITDMNKEMKDWQKERQAEIDKEVAAREKAAKEKEKEKAKDEAKGKGDKKEKKEKEPPLPVAIPDIDFKLDPSPATECRTPAEQAEQVSTGRSDVCWSAHMSDRARHVLMQIDGKTTFEPKKKLGKDDFDAFKKIWAKVMKSKGLRNFKGGDGWGEGDEFHLELPAAKIGREDQRAQACLDEYARLTRKAGKPRNDAFEKKYAKDLEYYIDKHTPKEDPKKKESEEKPDRSERPPRGSKADW
jgi:hypothetical protein